MAVQASYEYDLHRSLTLWSIIGQETSTVSGSYDTRGCLRLQTANIERWWHRVVSKVGRNPLGRRCQGEGGGGVLGIILGFDKCLQQVEY